MKSNSEEKIKHVVVLMFENRSFDHILGDMPGVNGLFDANGNLKKDIYNTPDPSKKPHKPNKPQHPFPITPGASEQEYIPNTPGAPSFNHDFTAMLVDLYGPSTVAVLDGKPVGNHTPVYPTNNCGFVNRNDFKTGSNHQYSVMSYFKWDSMKVFHKLAREFVVCDNWHCDMPGHTAPNRAFMHCATTGALGIDDNDAANETDPPPPCATMVYRETIFERLEAAGKTWKMYWAGSNLDTDFLNPKVGNQNWTGNDPSQTNCTKVPLTQFCVDVNQGTLPFYSFIMCFSALLPDASMHPQAPVEPGENLLAGVYTALRNSPRWDDTLLIVNFDENGGMYDHETCPKTKPPYPGVEPEKWPPVYEFDYSILGVRIPVLLISPWLNKGIDSTPLQNTSIMRYLEDVTSPGSFLTERDRHANSIALVFAQFGSAEKRDDCPEKLDTYPGTTYSDGICGPIIPTAEQLAAEPPAYLEELTREYICGLPGHPDSGKRITRHFKSMAEMLAYAEERREAAKSYYEASL